MEVQQQVMIVGGAAGSKIAFDIFRLRGIEAIGFVDNYVPEGGWSGVTPVLLGSVEDPRNVALLKRPSVEYFVATGDNQGRYTVTHKLINLCGKKPINAIHPTAVISDLSRLGCGNLVCARAVINPFASVGDGTIINTGAMVEHDNCIGDFAQISPGCTLCGYVTVDPFAFVGAGATVIPKVRVGRNALVAAGAVVISDVAPNTLVAGCPAVVKKTLQHA